MSGCIPAPVGKVFNEVLLKISQVFFTEPRILKKTKISVRLIKHFHYNKMKKKKPKDMQVTSHQCILVLPLWGQFSQQLQNRQDLEHY